MELLPDKNKVEWIDLITGKTKKSLKSNYLKMKIFQLNDLINDGKISENEAIDDLHVTLKKIGNDIDLKKDIETIFGNKESKSNELTTNEIEIKTENQSNINSVHTAKINIETQQNDSFFLKDNSEIENNFPQNDSLKNDSFFLKDNSEIENNFPQNDSLKNDSFFLKDNSEIENNFPQNETLKKENTLKLDVEDNNFSDIEKRKEKTKDNNQLKKDESIKRRTEEIIKQREENKNKSFFRKLFDI
jgi:hypothetical protein